MPRYLVIHKVSGEAYEVEAPFAQEACRMCGWYIRDCYVKLLREGPFTFWASPRRVRAGDDEARAGDGGDDVSGESLF